MIPKVVIFDLGKVLLDFDFSLAASRLEPLCLVTMRELLTLIDQSPLLFQFETGRITVEQFFGKVRDATGFRGGIDEFCAIFADIFTPIDSMIELHDELRTGGIPTFIFSNTNDLAIRHVRRRYPFFAKFAGYVLSYEHGVMKPDPKLYEAVESITGRAAGELCYIDDRPENITAALRRGWLAVVHESTEKTAEFIRKTGLLNGLPGVRGVESRAG